MDPAVLRASGGLGYVRERAALVDRAVAASAAAVPGVTDDAVAVVAVGGYGRRELFPGSDVDLVILHTAGSDRLAERVAEAVLYPLWDQGLATGNAVRTVDECRDAGGADPRALAALLDARLIAGSRDLVDQLGAAVDGLCGDAGRFVAVLEELREGRRRRHGFLAHATEPDLKESLGGLRDAPLLSWLARAGLAVGEAESLEGPTEILRRARVALHLCTGTRSNRLEAQEHGAVAGALGVADDPEWEARDALLRDVLRAGRTIDVTVGEALGAAAAGAGSPRATGSGPPRRARRHARVGPRRRPAGRAGRRARGRTGGRRGPWRSRQPTERWTRWCRRGACCAAASSATRTTGSPSRCTCCRRPRRRPPPSPRPPATARVICRRCPDDRRPHRAAARRLPSRAGKVGRGSHVEMGEEVAEQTLADPGAPLELRDDVAFLVREHLLLSDTATRRDISEEEVVLRVARAVGDRRRLAMLSV